MMDSLKSKKILVFGTGAVGAYYGGMLVKTGYDVTFIARGKNYEALRNNGLILIRGEKKENLKIKVFDDISDHGVFDYIFICVKSMDTKEAALKIKDNVGPETTVVSFQNGVENEEILVKILGEKPVIGGLVFVASKIIEPGVVYQFGYNGGLIGELDCSKTQRVIDLENIFQSSGVDMKIVPDIKAELWNKLVWNTSFNSISVLTGKTVDKMLEEDYELIKNIMTEVKNVAVALGINIRLDAVEFNLNRSKGFTGFKTSMLQDFERGKPLEIEELVGVVIKKAKEKSLSVPVTESVYSKLKEINYTNTVLN